MLTNFYVNDLAEAQAILTGSVRPALSINNADNAVLADLWAALDPNADISVLAGDTCIVASHAQGPWVFELPPAFVQALAGFVDADADRACQTWAAGAEMAHYKVPPEVMRAPLSDMRRLATEARSKGKVVTPAYVALAERMRFPWRISPIAAAQSELGSRRLNQSGGLTWDRSPGRARGAASVFTTGLVPMAAAQAQDTPTCEFKVAISKSTSAEGDLFTKDADPTIYGWFTIEAEATKVKPASKELLVSPTAMIAPAYYWRANGTLTGYALEVRNPYVLEQGAGRDGPTFETTLDVDGAQQTYSMATHNYNSWDTLDDFSPADSFGTLKKDVALTLGPPDGDPDGTSYTFSFPKSEIAKAHKTAQPQFTGLLKKAQAGQCKPNHQVTSSGSGTGSAGTYGCFLTTATCEAAGLNDDCWELRTLGKFRDGWLADQSGGMDDIQAYYAKAPAIVERLKGDEHALLRLYWTRVVPSALAAQIGANRVARAITARECAN